VVAAMDATQIEEEIPMVETAPFKITMLKTTKLKAVEQQNRSSRCPTGFPDEMVDWHSTAPKFLNAE